jgi:hypothetical protein
MFDNNNPEGSRGMFKKSSILVVLNVAVVSLSAMDKLPTKALDAYAAASVAGIIHFADAITPLCKDSPELEKLLNAISDQDLVQVQQCISGGVNVNARSSDYFGVCPLEAAVRIGNVAIVEALIDAGADVHAIVFMTGDSLLIVAENNLEMIVFLLRHGVNPNTGRYAPLLFAIHEKRADIVALLMQAGASYTIEDKEGESSTWTLVIRMGDESVWKTFLSHCTDDELMSMHAKTSTPWVLVDGELTDVLYWVRAEQAERLLQKHRWSEARAGWAAAVARALQT